MQAESTAVDTQRSESVLVPTPPNRYARAIEASKRARWDIDRDVIRGRMFDFSTTFLPDGLTKLDELAFLSAGDRRLMSQIQGRTYANVFGLVERFVTVKVLELTERHLYGDQTALEALVRFSDEELKHQELFRRIERMIEAGMPAGYRFSAEPNPVAHAVLRASTWAVLALTCDIELFTQAHYRQSIEPNPELSPLFKDVFLHHWKEESQHAVLDELEWRREDATLSPDERDRAVDDFIALVGAVDGILQQQASLDVGYFVSIASARFDLADTGRLEAAVLRAYRFQYVFSGAEHPRFQQILAELTTVDQRQRIANALASLAG
jgi:hypothetical protein